MNNLDARVEFLDEPEPLELDDILSSEITTLLVSGIVNPFGPTLNAIVAIGPFKISSMVGIVHLTLNPFQQTILKVADLIIGQKLNTGETIRKFFDFNFGACPSIVLLSKRVKVEKKNELIADFLANFVDGRETFNRIKEYFGNPWDRVSKEMNQAFEPPKKPSFFGKLFGGSKKQTNLETDELMEFAELLNSPEHIEPELKAFFYGWSGSIEHIAPGLATLKSEAIQQIFLTLALTLDLPAFQNKHGKSADDEEESSSNLGDLSGEELIAFLDKPKEYQKLSHSELDELVYFCIGIYGKTCSKEMIPKLMLLYRHYLKKVDVNQRERNYKAIQSQVIERTISPNGLLPYIFQDDDIGIVSTATLDFVMVYPLKDNDPMTGVRQVLDFIKKGTPSNCAAAFGGLVMLGDSRVMKLLKPLRNKMNSDQVTILGNCLSGYTHAATVEFFLSWLEELDGGFEDSIFGCLAAIVFKLAHNSKKPVVTSIERILPATLESSVKVLGSCSIKDFGKKIMPRLKILESKEKGEKVMPMVIKAWS